MPDDSKKTKAQLLDEVQELRGRVDKLESMATEHGRTEVALRESEMQFRLLFETSRDGIVVLTQNGRFLMVNEAAAKNLGYSVEEFLELSIMDVEARESRSEFEKHYADMLQGKGLHFETVHKSKDGSLRNVDLSLNVADWKGERITFSIWRDITERKRAEEALAEERRLLRTLIDGLPDYIYVKDAQSRFVVHNAAHMRLLGATAPDELVGKTDFDVFPQELASQYYADEQQVMKSGQALINREEVTRHPDGAEQWLLTTKVPLFDAAGKCTGLVGMSRDITQRKRAAEALRESEARLVESNQLLAGVLEHTHMMAVFLDPRFNFIWVNHAYADTCRHEPSFFPGKNHFDLYPHEENQAIFQRVVDTGEPFFVAAKPFEFPDQPERGVTYWDWSLIPVKDGTGKVTGLVFTLAEVTERIRAQEELRELSAEQRLILDTVPAMIWYKDLENRVLRVNKAGAEIVGVPVEEIEGKSAYDLFPDEAGKYYQDDLEVIKTGKSKLGIIEQLQIASGEKIWVHTDKVLIRDERGNPTGLIAFAIDITERKRAEEEKLALERQVQHAQKLESLGVLAGGIAHDFNNILAAVLGYADLAIADLGETHPALSSVREIVKGANRAAHLTRQMLAYSGKGRFVIEKLDVSALMDDMAHLLRTSIARTIALNLDLGRSLSPIKADAAQMQQVVMNLITNAADAIGDEYGAVTLSTGNMDCAEDYLARNLAVPGSPEDPPRPGAYVYFEVSDTGCGMDEETAARLFEPFFTTKFAGRGLGMAAALGIVRGHKGVIVLDTEPGKGSTFRVLFPAVEGKHADATEAKRPMPDAQAAPCAGTILVVDDEEAVRNLTAALLKRMGFAVLTAADGREAVEVFREHAAEVTCVFLDLTMPKMSGEACFEALRRIRDDVKVIVMSGYTEETAIEHFHGKSPDHFLQKPFRQAALKEKMEEILREERGVPHEN